MVPTHKSWFVFLAAGLLIGSAAAQPNTGTIHGVLTDNSGAVIPGVDVVIVGSAAKKTVGTQVDGSFTATGLPAGQYSLQIAFPGFRPVNQKLTLNAGATVQFPVQLALSSERQVVNVQSETAAPTVSVDPENNATALVLRGEDLESLPDDPDDLKDALEALAGPSAGPNGAQMFVDGFSSGILPPKESIREIRINQNPFSAEYDKLGMGRIEVFTKPGTDKFHGAAYIDYGNGVANSRNPYALNKPYYSNTMYGGTLSGPLGKHASFFLNADERNIKNNAVIHATTVDPESFAITSLQEAVLAPFRNTVINPRVDYQLTPNNTLVARYQYVTATQDDAGIGQFSLPSRAYATTTLEHNVQLTETAVLGPTAVNETRAQYSITHVSQSGDNSTPGILVPGSFTGGGAQIGHTYNDIDHAELTNSTTITHNTHSIHFGVRVRRDEVTSFSQQNFGGTFSFFGAVAAPVIDVVNGTPQLVYDSSGAVELAPLTSLQQYQRTLVLQKYGLASNVIQELGGGASQYSVTGGTPLTRFSQFDAAPFFQDDWRVRPNVTISLGMRYEVQTDIPDRRDLAPRIGIAWSPHSSGIRRFVIRGGVGVFYDRVAETTILQTLRFNRVTQPEYIVQNPDFFPTFQSPESLTPSAQERPTWYQLDKNLRAPYLLQAAVSVERQVAKGTTLALTFVNVHSLHLLQTVNINTPLPGTTDVYPYGASAGNLFQYESGGIFNQQMGLITFNTRLSRGVALFGNYAYTIMKSDVDNNGSPSNPYNFRQDYARSVLERRHRFQLVGTVGMPLGLRLSPFVILSSGAPYDLVSGLDLNGDSLPLDRPAFATDLSRASVRQTRLGTFDAVPIAGEAIVPRNYLTGDPLISLNARLARSFGFGSKSGGAAGDAGGGLLGGGLPAGARIGDGSLASRLDGPSDYRFTLTVSIIAGNIINHTNQGGFVGTLLSPQFGESTLLNGGFGGGIGGGAFGTPSNNRRLELQTRLSF